MYVCTYIHIYIYMYIQVLQTIYIHTYIHMYIQVLQAIYIHTYIHTYVHTIHTYIHTYVHYCIGYYIDVYLRMYMSTFLPQSLNISGQRDTPVEVCACIASSLHNLMYIHIVFTHATVNSHVSTTVYFICQHFCLIINLCTYVHYDDLDSPDRLVNLPNLHPIFVTN